MNVDHIFIETIGDNLSQLELAAVRTNHKGKVLTTHSSKFSFDDFEKRVLKPFSNQYVIISQSNRFKHVLTGQWFKDKTWLTISQLAWPLYYSDMISDTEFDTICKHFSIDDCPDDDIEGNCEALVRVYWALMKRYRTALIGEEAVRDFGGEALASVRKFIGI